MIQELDFNENRNELFHNSINPLKEIAAYEALWDRKKVSFKSLSKLFESRPGSLPSDFVSETEMSDVYDYIRKVVMNDEIGYKAKLLINNSIDFPERLKDAEDPVELLYYSGDLNLLYTDSIAIVGTRKPSSYGERRARNLTLRLVKDGYTIVSGLAKGIDTIAHTTAIKAGGRTISVIGTSLNEVYPKENKELQKFIANKHLLVSQVPFLRYSKQTYFGNRLFFPQRNKTMSAISKATIIIEAGETSGTLIQAKAALHQGRKLFILNSCFENKNITWPEKYLKKGAIRVKDYQDIICNLG